jgi:predicted nucleotidyltransferase
MEKGSPKEGFPKEMKIMKRICWKNYIVALLTLGLASCGGGGGGGGSSGPEPPIGPGSTPEVTSLNPAANARAVPVGANIIVVFDQIMNTGDDSNFAVNGSLTGKLVGTYSGGGTTTLSFDPDNDFKSGEEVEVTLTTDLTSTGGASLDPAFVYRFRVAVTETGSNANFVLADTVRVRDEPSSVTAGDWDRDGDLDLAVVNSFTDNVTVLLNDGSGGFSEAAGSPVRVGSDPVLVTAGDWDGDGDLDLAVVNSLTDNVTVLLNDGSGGFSEAVGSPIGIGLGARPVSVTAGDWDGDGDLDLAVVNSFTDNITVLRNGPQ